MLRAQVKVGVKIMASDRFFNYRRLRPLVGKTATIVRLDIYNNGDSGYCIDEIKWDDDTIVNFNDWSRLYDFFDLIDEKKLEHILDQRRRLEHAMRYL